MSDVIRKIVSKADVHESTTFQKHERRSKKPVNLRLKIIGNGGNGLMNGTAITPNSSKQSESFSALEELLQCGICLERLSHPRMLPCQHTFCLNCLKSHLTVKNRKYGSSPVSSSDPSRFTAESNINSMSCPVCQKQIPLNDGVEALDKLPTNLYLQSLLKVVEGSASPKVVENYRCVNCQMVSSQQEQVCQHCMQIFCSVCWNAHLAELESQLSLLAKQLEESEDRLKHKLENFLSRCDALEEKVKKATMLKVEAILREEKRVLGEVTSIKKEGGITSDILLDSISKLKEDINVKSKDRNNNHKVTTYLNFHRETSKILDQVNYFGEARITFDPDTFKLEQISEGIYNDDENQLNKSAQTPAVNNPGDIIGSMARQYKSRYMQDVPSLLPPVYCNVNCKLAYLSSSSVEENRLCLNGLHFRSFTPKLVWNKCPRPAGLGIPPWDDTKLYIAATDSHSVLILDRSKFKVIDRLTHSDMICPSGITFSSSRKELYVSDKWNHCIHVFSRNNEYLRSMSGLKLRSPDGIAIGPNEELIICDTGNDRVILADPQSGEKLGIIGAHNGVTQLNFPTSVAVYGQNIIIVDSGNNRIKTYNLKGDLLQEIGSFGKNPGQFRSAEVVAVDQFGFILVGDAGNARIQVFKPDGTLVKIFGSKSGFGWVSGILVTASMDIIAADSKTRCLRIF